MNLDNIQGEPGQNTEETRTKYRGNQDKIQGDQDKIQGEPGQKDFIY